MKFTHRQGVSKCILWTTSSRVTISPARLDETNRSGSKHRCLASVCHTGLEQKSHILPPPLPPREKDSKPHLPVPRSSRRTMTPIELDATEAERLSSTVLQRVCSNKSHKQSDAGLTASSPSPTLFKNLQAVVLGDQQPDGASGKGTIRMTDSTERRYTGNLRPQILEGMDFLDLASTGSGEAEDRIRTCTQRDYDLTSISITTLASRPPEEAPMDPLLTAEIISAAVESSRRSFTAPESEHGAAFYPEDVEKLPTIHFTALAIKRRKKRQPPRAIALRDETPGKRPDFLTFRRQMTGLERGATVIVKCRRNRWGLMPKTF